MEFDGLDGIRFDDGSRLDFAGECERHMQENRLLVSYSYRQPLGAFSGTLPGGIELAAGLGGSWSTTTLTGSAARRSHPGYTLGTFHRHGGSSAGAKS
ncbi:MAG TPA: hypothetical protein VKA47_07065 [Solirubrobacterales bacterium]|nr:hypothetical protein [Solirubrobacterales bacterium]